MLNSKPRQIFLALFAVVVLITGFLFISSAQASTSFKYKYPANLKVSATAYNAIAFKWDAVKNAPRYRIQVSTHSDMKDAVYYRSVGNATNRIATNLKPNTTYYTKVRVITADGANLSDYSKAVKAKTFKQIAAPVANKFSATTTTITASWDAVTGAGGYAAAISTDSTFKTYKKVLVTNPTVTFTGLTGSTVYYVIFQSTTKEQTALSPATAPKALQTSKPANTLPSVTGLAASSITTNSVKVSWTKFTGATKYRIYYTTSSSMPNDCGVNCKEITPTSLDAPNYSLTGLTKDSIYYVKVSAINSAGKTISSWQTTPLKVTLTKTTPPPATNTAEKVIVLVMENKGISQLLDPKQAPYISGIAKQYAYASNFKGMTHPSQPNYVYMAAGENKGITNNDLKYVSGPSVFGNSIKAGRTAKIYADNMGSTNCRNTGTSPYAFRHNPWIPFKDESALCKKLDVDIKNLPADINAGTLPNVGFIIPDNDHNAHDGSIASADKWFNTTITSLMAGPDYKAGKLLIVITADEDNKKEGQTILTVAIHPSLNNAHKVVSTSLNLVGLHRTLARFGHTPPLGKGAEANDMATAFGINVK